MMNSPNVSAPRRINSIFSVLFKLILDGVEVR